MVDLKRVEWILRIGIFGTFVGHGVFAWTVKKSWLVYFTSLGFSETFAIAVLPFIGMMDMLVGAWVLLKPNKYVLGWAAFWGFWTALVRPLAGEPIWDFVERWSNWAAPLALLYLTSRNDKRKK